MNEFLGWLALKRLSGWYFITSESIFYYKYDFRILDFYNYFKELDPFTENPFQHQCNNNTWLLTHKNVVKPAIPIDWCQVAKEWKEYVELLNEK